MIYIKKIAPIALWALFVLLFSNCSEETGSDTTTNATPETVADSKDPNAPAQSCVLSESEFSSWFSEGSITPNGVVNPANSLDSMTESCDFYKWSWHMFLWHFSPKEGSYVYDTPPFHDLEGNRLVLDGKQTRVRGGKLDREGQAGLVSGVLMSQHAGVTPDGSLVYYAIHVNDVYAYMMSGQKRGALDLSTFPTTAKELDAIVEYAETAYGVDIEDGESLTMELKSSWIKLPKGADDSRYVTIQASVPAFVQSSDKEWTWDGSSYEEDVSLALVGYHVVGSVAGHPEMVWATFEHVDNVPNVDYFYVNQAGDITEKKSFNEDGTPIQKDWVFTNAAVKKNASNQMHMELASNNIVAESGNIISPSSTVRTHPWGNKADSTSAKENTQIISLNDNIHQMLMGGDIRKKLLFGGYYLGEKWSYS